MVEGAGTEPAAMVGDGMTATLLTVIGAVVIDVETVGAASVAVPLTGDGLTVDPEPVVTVGEGMAAEALNTDAVTVDDAESADTPSVDEAPTIDAMTVADELLVTVGIGMEALAATITGPVVKENAGAATEEVHVTVAGVTELPATNDGIDIVVEALTRAGTL